MRKYEYTIYQIRGSALLGPLKTHIEKLNELGAVGWQMSGIFYPPNALSMDQPVTIFMRRPIEEPVSVPEKRKPGRPARDA